MKNNIRNLEEALGYAMARFKIDQTENNFRKMLDFAGIAESKLDEAAIERAGHRMQDLLMEWYRCGSAVMGPKGLTKRR
jgi:hypothetical protein